LARLPGWVSGTGSAEGRRDVACRYPASDIAVHDPRELLTGPRAIRRCRRH